MKMRWRWLPAVTGGLLLIAVGGWRLRVPPVPTVLLKPLGGVAYEPVDIGGVTESASHWAEPSAQSAGGDWVFEVFTPPDVFYNPEDEAFTVTPPFIRRENASFTVELLEVARELYRLQYAGHAGGPGRYRIEIHDIEAGHYLRGRVGDRFPEAEFSIEGFSVERIPVQPDDPDQTPYITTEIRLQLADARLGESIDLTAQPLYGANSVAWLRVEGRTFHLLPGQTQGVDGFHYELLEADADAGTALVRELDALGATVRTLALDQLLAPADP